MSMRKRMRKEENADNLYTKIKQFMDEYSDVQELNTIEIKTILSYYKQWNKKAIRLNPFHRTVLYFIAKKMIKSGYNDSQDIVLFIQLYLERDPSFPVTAEMHVRPLQGEKSLMYFTYHSHKLKRTFLRQRLPYKIYRMLISIMVNPDVYWGPVIISCFKYVILYGAVLSAYSGDCNLISPSELLAEFLREIFILNPDILPYELLDLIPREKVMYERLVKCMEACLEDLPQMDPNILMKEYINFKMKLHECDQDDIPGLEGMSGVTIVKKFELNILPNFESHFTHAISLQKNIRLTIRKILNEKWLLPDGINALRTPMELKIFIAVSVYKDT